MPPSSSETKRSAAGQRTRSVVSPSPQRAAVTTLVAGMVSAQARRKAEFLERQAVQRKRWLERQHRRKQVKPAPPIHPSIHPSIDPPCLICGREFKLRTHRSTWRTVVFTRLHAMCNPRPRPQRAALPTSSRCGW